MKLDLPTLLLALTVTSSVLAVAVIVVAVRAKIHRGLMTWGLGLAANALSYPTFGLRSLGWLSTSIILTNLLTALTLALHSTAIASFQSQHSAKSMRARLVWFLVTLNVCCAWLFMYQDQARNILVAGIQGGLAFILLCQAWTLELRDKKLTGGWIIVTGATLLVVTLVARTGFMVVESGWNGQYNVPDRVQTLTYLAILTVLQINSIGFVLMQMEHAISHEHKLATRDGLTGVYNRYALVEALKRIGAWSHRNAAPMALLMIDIDHFKAINDHYGHLVGDEVLREIAHRTEKRLRQSDILARYGGEEFLVVLPNTSAEGALTVAESIRSELENKPCLVQGLPIPVTVSIGIHAGIPASSDADATSLLAVCDQALYQAKRQGRNRVVVI